MAKALKTRGILAIMASVFLVLASVITPQVAYAKPNLHTGTISEEQMQEFSAAGPLYGRL